MRACQTIKKKSEEVAKIDDMDEDVLDPEQVKLGIGEQLLERFTATSVGRGQVGEVGERLPGAWRTGLASCTWTVETGQTLAMSQAVCLCYQSRQLMLC